MHLLVAISAHGFGHVGQVAPVVAALRRRVPSLRLTLRTTLPPTILDQLIGPPFELMAEADDVGVAMANAIDLDVDETARRYRALHEDWDARLKAAAEALREAHPDLVLADVPYLTLVAAKAARLPAVALCSLNWADIYRHYFRARPEAAAVHARIRDAYAGAEVFLRAEPAMPMADLPNTRPIGPLARLGRDRRGEMARALGLGTEERLVLVSLGGVKHRIAIEGWPRIPGVRFLVDPAWGVERVNAVPWNRIGLPFIDLVRTADALVTKPGYGLIAEAGCNGTAVLYVSRRHWPEEETLVSWLSARGRCARIQREALEAGALAGPLSRLWEMPRPAPPRPTGAEEAADFLVAMARGGGRGR